MGIPYSCLSASIGFTNAARTARAANTPVPLRTVSVA